MNKTAIDDTNENGNTITSNTTTFGNPITPPSAPKQLKIPGISSIEGYRVCVETMNNALTTFLFGLERGQMTIEEITHGLKLVNMVHNMIIARNGGIQRANEESKSAILYYT